MYFFSETKKYQQEKERLTGELETKKREVTSLKELLSIERAALDAEKRKCLALQVTFFSYIYQ